MKVSMVSASCPTNQIRENKKTYIWISDLQWQERPISTVKVDLKEDVIAVWQIFGLDQYELIDLSHIHRDFLNGLSV